MFIAQHLRQCAQTSFQDEAKLYDQSAALQNQEKQDTPLSILTGMVQESVITSSEEDIQFSNKYIFLTFKSIEIANNDITEMWRQRGTSRWLPRRLIQ